MRLATLQTGQGPRACLRWEGSYVDINAAVPDLPSSMREILDLGDDALEMAWREIPRGGARYQADEAEYCSPVPDPRKIICLGLNYRDHAIESGMAIPEEPVVFCKFSSALIGHGEPIVLPAASKEVDYEAELVVVIGRGGRDIPKERAMRHVAGYTIGHDVSARDWQLNKPGKQWLMGKTFDTFAPVGPEIVTADEVPDPHALGIRLRLNGQTMQDSSTAQLIFRIDEVIAYLSRVITLMPGDLIFTGTPPGVGMARKPPVYLKDGDTVQVEIEGLGVLKNSVVSARG